jgi:hypothetical protein
MLAGESRTFCSLPLKFSDADARPPTSVFSPCRSSEIYSTKLDLLRTGMGLARQQVVGIVGAEETV